MKLTSSAFSNNQPIPIRYTCEGENISPSLSITEVPDKARSLVLIMHDPDAVHGDWTHWLVWNIDPVTEEVPENSSTVESQEGTNSAEHVGYKGPCPPVGTGTHRYIFELYAVDSLLNLPSSTTREKLEASMEGRVVAKTELLGLYQAGGSDQAR